MPTGILIFNAKNQGIIIIKKSFNTAYITGFIVANE